MKIALIGYGKMGKEIEQVILDEGQHEIALKISSQNRSDFSLENLSKVDVAIEFTQPLLALENVLKCFEAQVPVVCGTTAWDIGLAQKICLEQDASFFASPNFSIGVNLFFAFNKQMARLMAPHKDYRLSMEEIHHTEKKDAPSGTAVKLAQDIIDAHLGYTDWVLGHTDAPDTIGIEAVREPHVPGTHHVLYESDIDKLTISHLAKSRRGFAIGAVRAAEFLYEKKGVYTMSDLLRI